MKKKIKKLLLIPFDILYKINPELETKIIYRLKLKQKLNLNNPKTFQEKLNWLKLYYRDELMPYCADKYTVRKYIEKAGGGCYLPKLYWHGTNIEDIPFEELPNQYIIKSTSGSGNNIIVYNKNELNKKKAIKEMYSWLNEKYLPAYGEWHYGKIKPSIIIEELLSDGEHNVPLDYKFFCFNNINSKTDIGYIAVDIDRDIEHKRNIYDAEFNNLPDVELVFPQDNTMEISKPFRFEEMKQMAKILANPFPHCRVDFYAIDKTFYIGELTFFPSAGFGLINPKSCSEEMGDWIKLPKRNH